MITTARQRLTPLSRQVHARVFAGSCIALALAALVTTATGLPVGSDDRGVRSAPFTVGPARASIVTAGSDADAAIPGTPSAAHEAALPTAVERKPKSIRRSRQTLAMPYFSFARS